MIRFNHVEITVPIGTVAAEGAALGRFFSETLGFRREAFPGLETPHLIFSTDADGSQFIFIAEHEAPASPAADDHLGLHLDAIEDVDAMLDRCRRFQAEDPRLEIRDFALLDLRETVTRAFYVRYLLPIWFDVQHIAYKPGFERAHRWQFLPQSPTPSGKDSGVEARHD